MTQTERARQLRPYIVKASASLTDADAVKAKELYDRWAAGMAVAVGDRLLYGERLYRVTQAHTTQEGWEPDKVPALFTVIDEQHAGTQDDPIQAARGMEYTYGLYYADPDDNKLYLCERTGEAAGGKIILQYLPHELIGQYFTEVEQ